ncbi:MAG: SMC-Scp complex subunit ScpB [Armatimonadetes bacterium]|nr:SMC-Scp complex subunit ScpB [Armatimonadota bacterium]
MTTQSTTEAPPREHLAILEAILFSSTRPQPVDSLKTLTGWQSRYIEQAMNMLMDEYAERGIQIRMVANGWQMVTSPAVAPVVEKMHAQASRSALSRAAMETLAIIAYRQPVTRAQIEALRGVKVDHIIPQLFEKNFIRELGRAQAPGRPMLLGTTRHFLTHFGLKNLDDLPELPPDETLSDVNLQHRVADALDAAEHQAAEQLSFGD